MNSIFLIIVFLIANFISVAQVLVPELEGKYKGDIKNGLAHGNGEAQGIDYYKGEFKKGLPNGEGTYTWKDGQKYTGQWRKGKREGKGQLTFIFNGTDTTLNGYWLENKFMGDKKRPDPGYKISVNTGIIRNYVQKFNDADDRVIIKFINEGRNPFNLLLQSSNGRYELEGLNKVIYDHVEFPFTVGISYRIENYFKSSYTECRFKITISEPGYWEIKLYN